MFSRQVPKTRKRKMRDALWPSMGWRRLMVYYRHRMGRLPGTPYFIASGFATGVAISFTPFIGFHLLMGFFLCWLLQSSVLAMAMGTLIAGNIWTLPLAIIASYKTGLMMMGNAAGAHPPELHVSALIEKPGEFFFPMLVGSVPLTLVSWCFVFFSVRSGIQNYRTSLHIRHSKKSEKILGKTI